MKLKKLNLTKNKYKNTNINLNTNFSIFNTGISSKFLSSQQMIKYFSKKIRHKKITLPSLSPSMETGGIASWIKKEGDAFSAGESIAGIETDKATVDFELNDDGFIAKILKEEGTTDIPLGEVIAITVENEEDIIHFKDYVLEDDSAKSTPVSVDNNKEAEKEIINVTKTNNTQTEIQITNNNNSNRIFISPLAKSIANKNSLDFSQIKGTGPNNRIIKSDVEEYMEKTPQQATTTTNNQTVSSSSAPTFEDVPISNIRKVIAERLVFSKQNIPHFYLNTQCNVDKLIKLREKLNKISPVKISFNDIVIKACSIACMKVPEANSSWHDTFIRMNKQVDISVAVTTDKGLITPIVFNADKKRLGEISTDVKNLAQKAKEGKLKPSEFQGGTFSVSNLGMMGISSFSAIINPGQSCILAVGKTEQKVIYDENEESENKFKVVNVLNATLSCDHRTVDGAVGAKWVVEFRKLMENPELMLL